MSNTNQSPAPLKPVVCLVLWLALLLWVLARGDVGQMWVFIRHLRPGLPETVAGRAGRAREEERRCREKAEALEQRLADLDRQIERAAGDRLVSLRAERDKTARQFKDAVREWAPAADRARCAAEAEEQGDLNVAPRIILDPEGEWRKQKGKGGVK